MVSHSVEGLDPKEVAVVDNNGIPLNTGTDSVSANTSTQIKLKKTVTDELEKKVYSLYSNGVDDFDTIRVIASPALDFDKYKSLTQNIQKPEGMDNGALITNKSTKETMDGGTTGGAAGTSSNPGNGNTPSYPTGTNSNGNYS
jgi:flagellar M-ring protein FliF